jgi:uncharacterized protein
MCHWPSLSVPPRGSAPQLLVSNAGRGAHGRAWEIPREVTTDILRLTTGVDLATALLPGMVARRRGGIIFVTSAGGFYPTPYLAAYGASKAFLLRYAEALATELRGTGVRAMALCPGPVMTQFGEVAGMSDLLARAPGLMTPADVVAAGLRAWDSGRAVHIPGTLNSAMTSMLARLPRAVTPPTDGASVPSDNDCRCVHVDRLSVTCAYSGKADRRRTT